MSQPPDPLERRPSTEWTDERVEQLLTWYFARQASLHDFTLIPSVVPSRSNHVSVPSPSARIGRWLALLCSVLLVCSVWIVSESLPVNAAIRSQDVVVLETTSLPLDAEDSLIVSDRGQYAVRNIWRWKSTSYFEPATGDLVECSTPELLIDIETLTYSGSESHP